MSKDNPVEEKTPGGITGLIVHGFKCFATETYVKIRPLTILAGANSSGKTSIMQPLLLMKQTFESSFGARGVRLDGASVLYESYAQITFRAPGCKTPDRLVFGFEHYGWGRQEWVVDLSGEEPALISPEGAFVTVGDNAVRRADAPCWTDIEEVLHVPGLRVPRLEDIPARVYPRTTTGPLFKGTFTPYAASVVLAWVSSGDTRLRTLNKQLRGLGLSSEATAVALGDTAVELRVGRLTRDRRSGEPDLVNIADVGLGVSQVLPVLVALLVAEPGRLVYLEQPELHLHPRAQHNLAEIIAEAAARGVRVVVETHSDLLILGVQALVAEGRLDPSQVVLHWFERDRDGVSHVTRAEPDESGRYGDWPEDFGAVGLEAQNRFFDAVVKRGTAAGDG